MIETLFLGSILIISVLFAYKNRFQETDDNIDQVSKSKRNDKYNKKIKRKMSRQELISELYKKNYNVLEELVKRCKKGGDSFSFIDNLSDEIKNDLVFIEQMKKVFGEKDVYICKGYKSSRERYTWECVINETTYEVWFVKGKFIEKNHSTKSTIKEYD